MLSWPCCFFVCLPLLSVKPEARSGPQGSTVIVTRQSGSHVTTASKGGSSRSSLARPLPRTCRRDCEIQYVVEPKIWHCIFAALEPTGLSASPARAPYPASHKVALGDSRETWFGSRGELFPVVNVALSAVRSLGVVFSASFSGSREDCNYIATS